MYFSDGSDCLKDILEVCGNTIVALSFAAKLSIAGLSQHYIHEDVEDSFREILRLLKEFEMDLHRHLHLENNILFPKALKLEQELTA